MNIQLGDKGKYGKNITYSEIVPDVLKKSYVESVQSDVTDSFNNMHFAVSTIWNNGHSLSESDAPQELRESVHHACDKIILLLAEEEKINRKLKFELIYFLSCLHKDMPKEGIKRLGQIINYVYYTNPIAYAIGDISLGWQKTLFGKVLDRVKNEKESVETCLKIFSIALWRNESLIYKLDDNDARNIVIQLKQAFEENISGFKDDRNCIILSLHLELLLALLRKRNMENKLLYPGDELTEWFLTKLNDVQRIIEENKDYKLEPKVELKVKKPKEQAQVPDIIYVLRQYLTGEDDNTIKIIGIDFEDE
jgi:hypothetical protein